MEKEGHWGPNIKLWNLKYFTDKIDCLLCVSRKLSLNEILMLYYTFNSPPLWLPTKSCTLTLVRQPSSAGPFFTSVTLITHKTFSSRFWIHLSMVTWHTCMVMCRLPILNWKTWTLSSCSMYMMVQKETRTDFCCRSMMDTATRTSCFTSALLKRYGHDWFYS